METQKSIVGINEKNIKETSLNPMSFHPAFPHIVEKIFNHMDKEGLKICRLLSKSWQEYIDNENFLWNKIMIDDKNSNETFQLACSISSRTFKGHLKMVKFLIKNSTKFNIDLNAKLWANRTIFHTVCALGHSEVAEIFVQNCTKFNIDLDSKSYGTTVFHTACTQGLSKIVEILIQKSMEFKIDLNAKNLEGRTAFHNVCSIGTSCLDIAKILVQNSAEFDIDLNSKDKRGFTGLHWACYSYSAPMISMLIENAEVFKIDLMVKDNKGRTFLQLAKAVPLKYNCIVDIIERKIPGLASTL